MAALGLRTLFRWQALSALLLLPLMACDTPGGGEVRTQVCVKAPQVRQVSQWGTSQDRWHCEGETP